MEDDSLFSFEFTAEQAAWLKWSLEAGMDMMLSNSEGFYDEDFEMIEKLQQVFTPFDFHADKEPEDITWFEPTVHP